MADDPVSDEDRALFREYMRAFKSDTYQKSERSSQGIKRPKEYHLSDTIIETVYSDTILSYSHPNLSPAQYKAIKHGTLPWEAQLDLHGLTRDQARASLCQFISSTTKRCLLIIHGKGNFLVGSPPVIKNLMNRWLPQFDEVLGFHSALPKDGGSGAVYVLLKRIK